MLPPSSSSKEGQSNAFPAHPWDAVVSAEMAAVITTLRRNQRWNIDSPVMSNSRSASESPGLRKTQPFSVLDAAAESSTTVADIQTFLATVVADKRVVGLGRQEDALLEGFTVLRSRLARATELSDLRPLDILHPFLSVVQCGDTTGPITGAALGSLDKFIQYNILLASHPNIREAVLELVSAVTRCKFEATDSVADEAVLASILMLLSLIIDSEAGLATLDDKSVCEMVEVAFGMLFQGRVSDYLRRVAQESLAVILRVVFQRFRFLVADLTRNEPESVTLDILHENGVGTGQEQPKSEKKFGIPSAIEILRVLTTLIDPLNRQHSDSLHRIVALELLTTVLETAGPSLSAYISWAVDKNSHRQTRPFSRKTSLVDLNKLSIKESHNTVSILETPMSPLLVDIQPHSSDEKLVKEDDQGNAASESEPIPEKIRTTRSGLIRLGLITKELLTNDLCKFVFQILQNNSLSYNSPPSWVTIVLVGQALRGSVLLLQTNFVHLKFQLEWFIEWCITVVDSGLVAWNIEDWMVTTAGKGFEIKERPVGTKKTEIAVGEIREMLLSSLYQLSRNEQFLPELYLNYDGDMATQSYLFEELILFFSRNSFPDATFGGPVTTTAHQSICFESVLLFVSSLRSRIDSSTQSSLLPASAVLRANKLSKKVLIEGSLIFNENPKKGLAFLQEHSFLPSPADPASIANLLVKDTFLDKKKLGIYLAHPSNQEVLAEFVGKLGFKGKRIDEALRSLLEKFRLPGESQQIERVMDAFADRYFADIEHLENRPIADATVACVLAYSIVMLHTDQHNPQVRRRMTFEDYARNVRGVNNGKDFDVEFLREIFHGIKDKEILMPEEHGGDLGFSYRWQEIQARNETYIPLTALEPGANQYDKDMFLSVWGPVVASLLYTFDNTEDRLILEKAMLGIVDCSCLASKFGFTTVLDYIIMSLAKLSGLNKTHQAQSPRSMASNPSTNTALSSRHAVSDFGRSSKSQLSCLLLFSISKECANSMVEGWTHFVAALSLIFERRMLSESDMQTLDFSKTLIPIPLLVVEETRDVIESNRKEAGLFSTLTQLLSLSSADEDMQAAPEAAYYLDIGKKCIASCRVQDLLKKSSSMDISTLETFLGAIAKASFLSKHLEKLDRNGEIVMTEYSVLTSSSVYLLSLYAEILVLNSSRLDSVLDEFSKYIVRMVALGDKKGTIIKMGIVKVIRILGVIIAESAPSSSAMAVVFSILSDIPRERLLPHASDLSIGLSQIFKLGTKWLSVSSNRAVWHSAVSLLQLTAAVPSAVGFSFEATSLLLTEESVTAENYGECVDLLLAYPASLASSSSSLSGSQNAASRKGKGDRGDESRNVIISSSIKSLNRLYGFHKILSGLGEAGVQSQPQRVFFEFWLPILSGLGQQCYHPVRDLRQHSFALLQKALMSPELETYCRSGTDTWTDCFDSVLFPLMDELLKANLPFLDPVGLDEARMRASALLCKVFLHFLPVMRQRRELPTLWLRILDYLQCYLSASRNEYLHEGICECLKNMFLVLSTQGMFHDETDPESAGGDDRTTKETPVTEKSNNNLWSITWHKLSTSVPHLKTELFPAKSGVAVPLVTSNRSTTTPVTPKTKTVAKKKEETSTEVEEEQVNLGATIETLKEEPVNLGATIETLIEPLKEDQVIGS